VGPSFKLQSPSHGDGRQDKRGRPNQTHKSHMKPPDSQRMAWATAVRLAKTVTTSCCKEQQLALLSPAQL
jgi:hypothetical protein